MTDPVTIITGAKILEMLLSATIGFGVNKLAGGASKALKDANDKLQAEAEQRVARMVAIVQAAAEDMTPELERIKEATGQDHGNLFQHPDFLAQVAQTLLFDGRPDLNQLEALYGRLFSDDQWQSLQVPLLSFIQKIKRRLQNDSIWGDVLQSFQIELQIAGLNETSLRIAETSNRIAQSIDTLPDRLLDETAARERSAIQQLLRPYLRGLYHKSNALPLAEKKAEEGGRQPRLQRVYVDLDSDDNPSWSLVLERLNVPQDERTELLARLKDWGAPVSTGWNVREASTFSDPRSVTRSKIKKIEFTQPNFPLQDWIETEEGLRAMRDNVSVLEAIRSEPQLVLLGDPGSGKSTLTRRIAGMLSAVAMDVSETDATDRDWQTNLQGAFDHWLLPVRIELSQWAENLPEGKTGVARHLIDECLRVIGDAGSVPAEDLRKHFTKELTAEPPQVLVLLDGLDEVSDIPRRKRLLQAITDFCKHYATVRLVVTCRIRPYTEGKDYALPLTHHVLAPLDDDAISTFLTRWNAEMTWAGIYAADTAEIARSALLDALRDDARPELHKMAGTPLLLTMMARLNYWHGLPTSRAALYDLYVNELLWEWEKRKKHSPSEPTSLEVLLQQAGVQRTSLERALARLAYQVHGREGHRDTVDIPVAELEREIRRIFPGDNDAKAAAWAVDVLQLIDDRSGLLYATEQRATYRFAHRSFQEFMAARWLTDGDYLPKFKERLDDEQWPEVVLLGIGYEVFVAGDYGLPLTVIDECLRREPKDALDWNRVTLLGDCYRLLGAQRAIEADREQLARRVMADVPRLLTAAMQNRHLPPRQRLEAGLLLADLDIDPPGLDEFVPVPDAGFSIGRYPVTNKQFRRFMDDGGYELARPWWTQNVIAELKAYYRDDWVKGPRYWDNRRLNRSTQPVVGVSWYEAVAYCTWLTERLRDEGKDIEARLPTLEQWRQAAGSQTYPWGPEFDPSYANTTESGLDQTTPVHMYPESARRLTRAAEVWDMAGNAWEWTVTDDGDTKNPYYYLCGGSWYNGADSVGTAARSRYPPGPGGDAGGFRVVVVSISRP